MNFFGLIGNKNIKNQFEKAFNSNTVAHAHLIAGEDGIGKSILAKAIAINILGKTSFLDYVDVKHIRPSKKSIGVDEIRDIISEVSKKPYEGETKVIIVHNAEKITPQGQNAFLKTIEEPPKGVYLLLLCENLELILNTIKSRCQIHKLNKLNLDEINEFINLNYKDIDKNIKKAVIAFSDGIPGKIIKFFEDDNFIRLRNLTIDILVNIKAKGKRDFLAYSEELVGLKDYWQEVLNIFISYIRDGIVYKETNNEDLLINIDKIEEIKKIVDMYSFKRLNSFIDTIFYVKNNMKSSVNPGITFDMMLLRFQEV